MTQKTKRRLLITIPAAVLIAAALLLWLFLGRGTQAEQPFEIRRDQQSNQIVYCALKGMVDEQEAAVMEFPCYSFHPPEVGPRPRMPWKTMWTFPPVWWSVSPQIGMKTCINPQMERSGNLDSARQVF